MEKLIHISDLEITLEGMLKIPENCSGIVVFAHGSGSSRFSPRNNFVSNILNEAGFGTLLIDLLSPEEDEIYQTRFDIDLLAKRLGKVVDWLKKQSETKAFSLGLFGSSTGAAAALIVAASFSKDIKAVVSRGGRPDLALPSLEKVKAPTLFIVGGKDFQVIELNQVAYERLECLKDFKIIPNATHLFEEKGCLEQVAILAKDWFEKYFKS